MSKLEARWIKYNTNTLEADALRALNVKVDTGVAGGLEATSSGIRIKPLGVTNDMLAGSIEDAKLATAYVKADGSRAMTGNLNMGSHRITNLSAGVNPSDAVTVAQLQVVATQAKVWKEAVLYKGQLAADGIRAAQALILNANLQPGDTIVLNDGTTTESYVAGTNFTIGSDINQTLTNLANAINAGAIAASAVSSSLTSLDDTNDVIIIWQDTVGEPTRIYGNGPASSRVKIINPSLGDTMYDATAADLVALPTSDPGVTNFGFYRPKALLVPNETHIARESDETYTFDSDAGQWRLTGAASIPYASKTMYGKVMIGNGIQVANGIINVAVDAPLYIENDVIKLGVDPNTLYVYSSGESPPELRVNYDYGLTVSNGKLAVNPVDFTGWGLEVSSDKIQISSSAVGAGLTGGSGTPIAVNPGNGLVADASGLRLTQLSSDWDVGTGATIKIGKTPSASADAVNKGYLESYVSQQLNTNVYKTIVEQFTLTSTDITNKRTPDLQYEPVSYTRVIFDVKGAPQQFYGDDYVVVMTGSSPVKVAVSWYGLNLDGILVEGDEVRVIYDVYLNV